MARSKMGPHSPRVGVWPVCEDTSRRGKKGEEEQADAGQRWVQEDDGGGKADTKVNKFVFWMVFCLVVATFF